MSESTLSLIRHALTALGVVLTLLGLGKWTGATDYLVNNLDGLWAAISAIIGIVTTFIGFFKNQDRLNAREELKSLKAAK